MNKIDIIEESTYDDALDVAMDYYSIYHKLFILDVYTDLYKLGEDIGMSKDEVDKNTDGTGTDLLLTRELVFKHVSILKDNRTNLDIIEPIIDYYNSICRVDEFLEVEYIEDMWNGKFKITKKRLSMEYMDALMQDFQDEEDEEDIENVDYS